MSFEPVYKPFDSKPKTQWLEHFENFLPSAIRENFYLTTWLLIGASIQGVLTLVLPYPNIALVAPAFLFLAYRTTIPLLQTFSLLPNPYLKKVIPGRTAPLFPSTDGTLSRTRDTIATKPITVAHFGAQSNHPLGLLAPGYKQVADYFTSMIQALDSSAAGSDRYGFLGGTPYLGIGGRGAASEVMAVLYFESAQGLHDFAAFDQLHQEAMRWWKEAVEKGTVAHVGLMHEIFTAGPKQWEGIYLNYEPTLLAATAASYEVGSEKGVEGGMGRKWFNPLVYGTGPLRFSRGRLGGKTDGEHERIVGEMAHLESDK